MMNEFEIEKYIAEYLQGIIEDYSVEPYSTDLADIIQRAQEHSNGLITVSHSNQPASYGNEMESNEVYTLEQDFVMTILVNDRQSREDLYELFHRVRKALLGLTIEGKRVRLSRHRISTGKFPDMLDGVHMAEIEVSISGYYY